jgi:hypothetical protein
MKQKETATTILFEREVLYEEIWSAPVLQVAKRYGISDVGLAKICKKMKIPKPPRGYWAKRSYGVEMNPEAANHRILQLNNARFPRSEDATASMVKSISQLGQSLETIKEKINNLNILRANFVAEMDGSPLLNDEDIRQASPLFEIEKKLRSRKERLNGLDQLSGLLDAEHGCRQSITEHLRLSKTPPDPVKSALKEHISWLSQLSDAARLRLSLGQGFNHLSCDRHGHRKIHIHRDN